MPSILFYVFTFTVIFVKFYLVTWISRERNSKPDFSYVGQDYPNKWMFNTGPPVQQIVEPEGNLHYRISGKESAMEWDALVPNDGIISLGEAKLPFSISMFHQLRCLNILRTSFASGSPPAELERHCLNYLRQMALCQSDLGLELEVRLPEQDLTISERRICNDWSAVYKEIRENQAGHNS